MKRAHLVDSVRTTKFWFCSDVMPSEEGVRHSSGSNKQHKEMTMSEIMNGKDSFPGLVPLCYAYLDHIQCDAVSFERIDKYLTFIKRRSMGELITPATWMRRFVRSHPEYKQDSVITQGIAYDLMRACDEIGKGQRQCTELLGDVVIDPITTEHAYDTHLQ